MVGIGLHSFDTLDVLIDLKDKGDLCRWRSRTRPSILDEVVY